MTTFNQTVIHDLAAHLFWTLADEVGVARTVEQVIESAGRCLLKQPFSTEVLSQYDLTKLSPEDLQTFLVEIAAYAERKALDEENMQGIIYAEDAQTGRSPSAMGIDTAPLEIVPKKLTGSSFETLGSLCLRHPLPAVVFTRTPPKNAIIEVEDTAQALGFHLPMYLVDVSCQQITDELYVMSGIFRIPVPSKEQGERWNHVIQNSIHFLSGITCLMGSSALEVEVEWE